MGKVKIKDLKATPGDPRRRHALWTLAYRLDLSFQKVIASYGGFTVLASDETVELIIEKSSDFQGEDFLVIDPPELRAMRTLILTGVDDFITSHPPVEIKQEIERANRNCKVMEVILIPSNSSVLKIRFENLTSA